MTEASTDLDMQTMRDAASATASLLRTLGNPDRLLLLCQLSQGERAVGELEELVGLRQPSLSQQLAVLRNEGLVQTRRDGKRIFYRIAEPRLLVLLGTLYQLRRWPSSRASGHSTCMLKAGAGNAAKGNASSR